MTPTDIKALRATLAESCEVFGKRFMRSGRTVECWEQGLRQPDQLVLRAMARLQRIHAKRLTGLPVREDER